MKHLGTTLLSILLLGIHHATALDGPTPVRTFGPTGLEIEMQDDQSVLVKAVAPHSPADGKINAGSKIITINGTKVPADFWESRMHLGRLISEAEAGTGVLELETDTGKVELRLPPMGAFSETWPVACPKTERIISLNAVWLRKEATTGKGFTDHSMVDGLGILALLSTGEKEDLEVVRGLYAQKMKSFTKVSIGPHSWHNGYQGIAACEYFLRTGDPLVMPLINQICEAAKRYQVHGGYYHWATAANPKYGVVNATGTNMLTFLLLAKHCGAQVDDKTLNDALVFFYRFIGHGCNAYGDGRPESGLGSNGKTEQIAAAMRVATLSENGRTYALAADKASQSALYNYRAMLNGHTGPIGNIWFHSMVVPLAGKQPDVFRERQKQVQWFYELSRLHDHSFVMSSCRGYDNASYGRSMLLGLTAPRKTLRITGAPKSEHGVAFTLPEIPWGRPADLAFFDLKGAPTYRALDPSPHLEFEKIKTAVKAGLSQVAGHPEQGFREAVAAAIRAGNHFDLIEELLASPYPYERHTACLAINQLEQWQLRNSKGWLSGKSIDPANFSPAMFDRLIAMVRNPQESIWLADQALIALAAASPAQITGALDSILPWLQHDDWWFLESVAMALSPTFADPATAARTLPALAERYGRCDHIRGRNTIDYLMTKNAGTMPPEVRNLASTMFRKAYESTPTQVSLEGGMDLSAITSVSLAGTIATVLDLDPELAPAMAEIAAARLREIQAREQNLHIDALIHSAAKLAPGPQKAVGAVLNRHFRQAIYQENAIVLAPDYNGPVANMITPLNTILQIDQLAGSGLDWKLLDPSGGESQWQVTSFDPQESLKESTFERYRKVTFPAGLENWFAPDFQADPNQWITVKTDVRTIAPRTYRDQPFWKSHPDQGKEVLLFRKTLHIDDLHQQLFRLVVFSRQGYQVYINGKLIVENKGRTKNWLPRMTYEDAKGKIRNALVEGENVIAATTFLQYFKGKEGDIEVYLEGLKQLPTRE